MLQPARRSEVSFQGAQQAHRLHHDTAQRRAQLAASLAQTGSDQDKTRTPFDFGERAAVIAIIRATRRRLVKHETGGIAGRIDHQFPVGGGHTMRLAGIVQSGHNALIQRSGQYIEFTPRPGEIVSRGRIVMPGYWNNPDASAAASWTDPSGRLWLRTGDIGKLDAERFLQIVDRKKDMIISGGQNIYPADIERVLITHDGISGAAVIGLPDAVWGETPVAIVEAKPGVEFDTGELLDWVNQRVGKRQRITALHVIDELPRNPNGKVLKRELRTRFTEPA